MFRRASANLSGLSKEVGPVPVLGLEPLVQHLPSEKAAISITISMSLRMPWERVCKPPSVKGQKGHSA
jgi:hypothetical protein